MKLPKPHVLVIDDEAAVRATLQRYLTLLNCQVTWAASGEEALKLLEAMSPELVFLDLTMPGGDGMGVLGQLREKHDKLPVIMLAGKDDIDQAHLALNCGACDFLPKPVDLTALKRLLLIHLKR